DLPQLVVREPEVLAAYLVLAADRSAEVRRAAGAQVDPHSRLPKPRQRVLLVGRVDAEHDVARGAALEERAALGELGDQLPLLDRAHPVRDPGDRQLEAAADALGARPLAGMDRAAEPRPGCDSERLGVVGGRVVRLVA